MKVHGTWLLCRRDNKARLELSRDRKTTTMAVAISTRFLLRLVDTVHTGFQLAKAVVNVSCADLFPCRAGRKLRDSSAAARHCSCLALAGQRGQGCVHSRRLDILLAALTLPDHGQ